VKSETKYDRMLKENYQDLLKMGIEEGTADLLYDGGFQAAADILASDVETLSRITGLAEEEAEGLIDGAALYVAQQEAENSDTED
jgi:hypothetical protein